jgi:hypothetical protein
VLYTSLGGSTPNADDLLLLLHQLIMLLQGLLPARPWDIMAGDTGSSGTYNAVSGTNYQTGSGLEFELLGSIQRHRLR